MNPVVKAQLQQFIKNNPNSAFQEQDHFELYSIHSICNGHLGLDIAATGAHLRGTEFGLDGVGVLINGSLCPSTDEADDSISLSKSPDVSFIFTQSKRSEKFDYGDISKFLDGVWGFFSGDMGGESEQLDDLASVKDRVYQDPLQENPKLLAFFVTTGTYEKLERIEKLLEAQRKRLEDLNLFSSIEFYLTGAKELQEYYRIATRSSSVTIEFTKCQTLPENDSVEQAHMGYIEASELLKLISAGGSGEPLEVRRSVFVDNIRDYNPSSEINKSISEQLLRGDKSSFVYKNNGVTVVSRSISRTGDKFTLQDYQIVNGCQTCNILFSCRSDISGVNVPLRLIGTKDESFISSVVIGTNQQNPVKDEQFWALRPFMKDLEEYCQEQHGDLRIFLERREYQYRAVQVERTRVVKPSELMKCVAAMYLHRPHRAARDYRGIRKEFEAEIFQEGHDVRFYHLACLGNYKFDFIIRNSRVPRDWNLFKYYGLYSIGYIQSNGRNVFSMTKKEQEKVIEKLSAVLSDEDTFVKEIKDSVSIVFSHLKGKKSDNREQIRDAIRADAFAKSVEQSIKSMMNS